MPKYKCYSIVLFAPAVNAKESDAKTKATAAVPASVASDIAELEFTVDDRDKAFDEVYKVLAAKLKTATSRTLDPDNGTPTAWSVGSGGLHEDTRPLTSYDAGTKTYVLWDIEFVHKDGVQLIRAFASLRVRTVAV